ncbi:stress responsive A/B barrel domain protein [Drechmeria coniospora]|uniref:Stress responsive A/B barrel domain protein n=1 Tax=Drechmeria coniospora TaxID=98403 RepID=A0A151GM67_DRECN|nr:stress responsive A/B barrel domain protein [Drechmeria coniospora]KYK58196.1 stress responsive A/B barrel domain protein [Drechmeria coniospora]
MTVTHIVLLAFKPDASAAAVEECIGQLLGLKEACVHPETRKPYIKSSSGGKDMSIEGLQQGITHAYVVEFASVEDRDYYVRKDPAHLAFVKNYIVSPDTVVMKGQVVDFVPGNY